MANPEHLAKLKKGMETWQEWRLKNPETIPDLTNANLSRMDLRGTNFTMTNLKRANFQDTNLEETDFKEADLTRVDFTRANLTEADFARANLWGARSLPETVALQYLQALIDSWGWHLIDRINVQLVGTK